MDAHDLTMVGATGIDALQLGGAGAIVTLFDDDSTLTANSNNRVATQAAVKSYVDAAVPGTGNLIFQMDSKVEVTDTGGNGQVVMDADAVEVLNVTSTSQRLGVSGDTNVFVNQSADNVTVTANNLLTMTVAEGQVTVHGDLSVDGTTFVVNNQEVTTSDNIIVVNNGEPGAGVTAGSAGLEVNRGSLTAYQMLFDESQDNFRVGEVGALQAVATREDSPTDQALPYWNNSTLMFSTANARFKINGNAAEVYNGTTKVFESSSVGILPGLSTFHIRTSGNDNGIRVNDGGSIALYYNNSLVAQTTAAGITGAVWG